MGFEDDYGPRWDKCIVSAVTNVGYGTVIGLVLSTAIFKRKRWAFLLGLGFGIGMAYSACDYEVNHKSKLPPCSKTSSSSNGARRSSTKDIQFQ